MVFRMREACEFSAVAESSFNVAPLVRDTVWLARPLALLISSVPQFSPMMEDAARRFVNLVDEFYDRGVNLVLSAATPITELYDGEQLRAEFSRTESRLIEMQSREYLASAHKQ